MPANLSQPGITNRPSIADKWARMKPTATINRLPRSSGILLHLTSLPGAYGVGDMGPVAHEWVRTLAAAQQSWWQILPLGPGDEGFSPYSSLSAHAGNPLLISPEALVDEGLLSRAAIRPARWKTKKPDEIDFPAVERHKAALLHEAWQQFRTKPRRTLKGDYHRFRRSQKHWLDDFALFVALRQRYENTSWTQWPKSLVERRPEALRRARRDLAEEIDCIAFFQFLFFRQWQALRRSAKASGVKIIGDVPIFVAQESADVWANPQLFLLDRQHRPRVVAGVPPDYFSKTGQRWGNPMYDWAAMAKQGFAWWLQRFGSLLEKVDLVRIDHFRGFAACWHIPASAPDARKGKWVCSPGEALFKTLAKEFRGLPFIAEDLGLITPDVVALRDRWNLPGMRVLQFAFGDGSGNPFLPHNYVRNAIAYTGTHDNDTTAGWYRSLPADQRRRVLRYAPDAADDPAWAMIRLAWASVADVAIAPMQDLLSLGSKARMNTPGRSDGNWAWRMGDLGAAKRTLARLAELTEIYGRSGERK